MAHPDTVPHPSAAPRLPQGAELYRALLDQIDDGVYLVDRERRIQYWNAAAERITGYLAHEVVGRRCQSDLLMHRDEEGNLLCGEHCPLAAVIVDGQPKECSVSLRHKNGHCLPVAVRARALHDGAGAIVGAVEMFRSAVAPGRAAVRALEPYGCLDRSTGAVTRQYGEMQAAQRMAEWQRFGVPMGWVRLQMEQPEDLEHRYGGGVLEAAMMLIAHTLDGNLASGDTLARWGRTEFRIIVPGGSQAEVADLARRLAVLVESSNLEWWGDPLLVNVSAGSAVTERGDSLESLELRAACRASRPVPAPARPGDQAETTFFKD